MEERKGEKYGVLLRRLREQSGKSMGALARHLGLTAPYLCDVELGRRAPLATSHTLKAAAFLGIDPHPLLLAAIQSREAVEIRTPTTDRGRLAIAALQRRGDSLTDEQWERIQAFIDGENNG